MFSYLAANRESDIYIYVKVLLKKLGLSGKNTLVKKYFFIRVKKL